MVGAGKTERAARKRGKKESGHRGLWKGTWEDGKDAQCKQGLPIPTPGSPGRPSARNKPLSFSCPSYTVLLQEEGGLQWLELSWPALLLCKNFEGHTHTHCPSKGRSADLGDKFNSEVCVSKLFWLRSWRYQGPCSPRTRIDQGLDDLYSLLQPERCLLCKYSTRSLWKTQLLSTVALPLLRQSPYNSESQFPFTNVNEYYKLPILCPHSFLFNINLLLFWCPSPLSYTAMCLRAPWLHPQLQE